jgi:hypothetical protein
MSSAGCSSNRRPGTGTKQSSADRTLCGIVRISAGRQAHNQRQANHPGRNVSLHHSLLLPLLDWVVIDQKCAKNFFSRPRMNIAGAMLTDRKVFLQFERTLVLPPEQRENAGTTG